MKKRTNQKIDTWSYNEKGSLCGKERHEGKELPHFTHTYRRVHKSNVFEELKLNDPNDFSKGFTVCWCGSSSSLGDMGSIPNSKEYMEIEKRQRIEYWSKRLTLPLYEMQQAKERHDKWNEAYNNLTPKEKEAYYQAQIDGLIAAVKNWK